MCKWFKHDVLAHRDKKLRALRAKHGHNGTGIYFHLLEVMGYDDDGYLPYDLNALSIELGLIKRKDREVLAEVISDFGLFEFTEEDGTRYFYSPRFVEQLEGIGNASEPSTSTSDASPTRKSRKSTPESKAKRAEALKIARAVRAQNVLDRNAKQSLTEDLTERLTELNNNPLTEHSDTLTESLTIDDTVKDTVKRGDYRGENKDIRIKNKENIDSVGAKPQKRFVPPTPEEVRDYCSTKGYPDESEKFVDYHTSKGWRVGNSPMKDWKAALRYWMSNNNRQPNTSQSPRGERLIRDDSQMDKVRDARW